MQTKRLTPKETLHAWCHYCIQDRRDSEVENCGGHLVYATGKPCPFFPYRMGKRPPMKVFRQFCLECMGGSFPLVKECEKEDCPMHPYRFGKNPNVRGAGKERMDAIRSPGSLFSPVKMNEKRFLVQD
jgi:hypothetical protein